MSQEMNHFSKRPTYWKSLVVIALTLTTWALKGYEFGVLWPTVVAIGSTLALRSALAGLMLGALSGSVLIENGSLWRAFSSVIEDHTIPALQSGWNLSVLIFTLALGGFVALIEYGGGFQALLERLIRPGKSKKIPSGAKLQWSAFGMGLVCFFDGLANSLLVGRTLKPFAAKVGVSREKLAYIVDSTSAAVACVAFISTWIAYQLAMIREGFDQANVLAPNHYPLFLKSIPYNFYCWATLALLALVIWKNWNIGPMRQAELNAALQSEKSGSTQSPSEVPVESHLKRPSVWKGALPILFLFGSLLIGLYQSGSSKLDPDSMAGLGWMESAAAAFGAADAALVFVLSTLLAGLVALALNWKPGPKGTGASFHLEPGMGAPDVFMEGVKSLFGPALILVAAWTLSSTLKTLEAGPYLAGFLEGRLPDFALPASVFVLGAVISFTTGTSWGTMGVLMPLALPVVIGRLEGMEPEMMASSPMLLAVVGAVFSGAVFGDHCSPISDTTIVSSIACDVEPVQHVKTQMPYALLAAGLSVVLFILVAL